MILRMNVPLPLLVSVIQCVVMLSFQPPSVSSWSILRPHSSSFATTAKAAFSFALRSATTTTSEGSAHETTTTTAAAAPLVKELPVKYDMDDIVSLCKRRGIIFPSSEIYNGYAGFYDYGPLGSELKKNVKDAWWKFFVTQREDVVGLDSSIIHNPATWKSSGTWVIRRHTHTYALCTIWFLFLFCFGSYTIDARRWIDALT